MTHWRCHIGQSFMVLGMQKTNEAAASLLEEMKTTAAQMRELIVGMPPHDLLGYIYSRHLTKAMKDQSANLENDEPEGPDDLINQNQFLLEYVHAVLASDEAPAEMKFDESQCSELYVLGNKLRGQAVCFAMVTSSGTKDGIFGPDTADVEFQAKSNWVMLRGNRYQVLEGEFYRYVLTPHNDVLKEVYGTDAAEIAEGFQAMADATRSGHANAIEVMMQQYKAFQSYARAEANQTEDAVETWAATNAAQSKSLGLALDDILRGGVANVSRHTKLPPTLLSDLAYERGEENEFFGLGDFAGTPYQTLPARKKPLIQLGSDYYAVDPCFTRDAGYRALLHNLLQRKPEYKKLFEDRQKEMSESAFADIMSAQLPSASVFNEIYYKDPISKQWVENDTLILLDDVLFLVEAKAGAAATIASPALDFARHAQSVQDLVLKAYTQCERFFNYLNSADEVPLYYLIDGKYTECCRVRRSDYRVMLPIGLTVETFSPFSTCCKELPQVEPLLERYAFFSLSIDELLVLSRFLPTPGSFAHYMEVRQAVAGIRRAHLFDEFDHLGAYLIKNRFDQDIVDQLKDGKVGMLIWDQMSGIVDRCFEGENWENEPFPAQRLPEEVVKLLEALDATRSRGWLSVESHIRDLGEDGRSYLAKMLFDLRPTLKQHPTRYFVLSGERRSIFIWLQQQGHEIEWTRVKDKASAAALALKTSNVVGVVLVVRSDGAYAEALSFAVHTPTALIDENAHIYADAEQMAQPNRMTGMNK
jgi:hypothetical protein